MVNLGGVVGIERNQHATHLVKEGEELFGTIRNRLVQIPSGSEEINNNLEPTEQSEDTGL